MPAAQPIAPFLLDPWFSPRPWGTLDLSPWYALKPTEPIGEAWLTGDACTIATGAAAGQTFGAFVAAHRAEMLGALADSFPDYPLLLKILFPHDKLSVQVHPDDALAAASGQLRGKTECWYVLSAEPGAGVALGLKPGADAQKIRSAVNDRTMEDLLENVPVSVGDMVFVDAGTVHAIGPGVILLETQQTSDITYRLYDYGRPRELHVEKAIEATRFQTSAGKVPPVAEPSGMLLIKQQYFSVDRIEIPAGGLVELAATGTPHTLVLVEGDAEIVTGTVILACRKGQAAVIPGQSGDYALRSASGGTVIRSIPPLV
jgi:mannose-6-phosphate isomerase